MILLQLFNGSCIELGAVRRGQDSELAQQAVQEIQQRRPAPAPAPATKEKDPAPVGPKEPKAKVEATQKIEAPEPLASGMLTKQQRKSKPWWKVW